ncbi:predicted protein [Histoplasma capsulatum var. duboisii H88]|uniref:Predicted protein n=1 Tax=Ajellomyces capsulatus (strain H88) TaxID=544711 RepID=F0UA58_AJEC8|nr:predicted protein [Histoplasma capsulatum var. duboisii H88]
MGWNELPIELVHLIISHKNIRPHDLANLARVNRHLAGIVPQYLYRDVQFISAHPSGESKHACLKRLAQFNRTITRNPRLARLTRSIAIKTCVEDEGAVGCIWEVLAKLYSLEKLVLSTATEDRLHLVLQRNVLARLRCADINGDFVSLVVAACYMQLPAMESLKVESGCLPLTGRRCSPAARLPPNMERQTSLKRLAIRVPSECSSLLPRLLSCCPNLATLALSIQCRSNTRLEQMLLSNALNLCQETITTLELDCEYGECRGYFECCPIVFRPLKCLRTLKIEVLFLFTDEERGDPTLRNDIHQWLPTSLEYLELLFQHTCRAFETTARSAADGTSPVTPPATYKPEYVNWLLQIGMNKEARLPKLVHVCVREGNNGSPSPYKVSKLPAQIEAPFREAGIGIQLLLLPCRSRPF